MFDLKNIEIKKLIIIIALILLIGYIAILTLIYEYKTENVYSLLAIIIILVMILTNILKLMDTKEWKYFWKIIFNLIVFLFIVLVYINFKLVENCLSEDSKNNYLVYTLLILSIYLYIYKERSLADCSYLSFSKILMFLSMILSFIHDMDKTLIISLFIYIYMMKG